MPVTCKLKIVVSYSISTSNHNERNKCKWSAVLYLIPFLHQTTTFKNTIGSLICCILFHFYIKPQLLHHNWWWCLVVSYSISTSNHNRRLQFVCDSKVVSYSISTSNHNNAFKQMSEQMVVSYSISTSNHNFAPLKVIGLKLYLIPFLHQTTTSYSFFVYWG